jgi:uncharacterized protein (TIGR00106 family)
MIVEFSIMPVGKGESLSQDVAEAIKIIKEGGLPYQLGPMGTCIEGEWEQVMEVINKCRKKLHEKYRRVYIVIKIDDKEGAVNQITYKVRSVEEKLSLV